MKWSKTSTIDLKFAAIQIYLLIRETSKNYLTPNQQINHRNNITIHHKIKIDSTKNH